MNAIGSRIAAVLAAALLAVFTAGAVAAAPFKVIVNEANAAVSVSKEELRGIYMGKSSNWRTGQKAAPIDLVADSHTREGFSESVLGKSVSAVLSHWQRQIFSGKGVPPPEVSSDQEVASFVRRNPGAVGYVSDAASVDGVRVVPVKD